MFSFTKKGIQFKKYTPSELEIHRVSPPWIRLPVGAVYLEPGDPIHSGQKVSELEGVPVCSPCAGVFTQVVKSDTGNLAVIRPHPEDLAEPTYHSLKIPTLEELVQAAQLLRSPGLTERIRQIAHRPAVIRALDEGPDRAEKSGLLCGYLREIVSAVGWLEKLSGQPVCLYTNNPSAKFFVQDHSAELDVRSVSGKYPSAYWLDRKLEKTDGVLLDVGEVRGLFHCIAYGHPPKAVPVSRCVWGKPVEICEVPVGTPVSALFEEIPEHSRFVLNGVLQGKPVSPDTPITLSDGSVTLVEDADEHPTACIGCGKCANACPVGLLPMLIHEQWQNREKNSAKRLGAHRCIGCGACSYICPSKLPLCARIRAMAEVSDHA